MMKKAIAGLAALAAAVSVGATASASEPAAVKRLPTPADLLSGVQAGEVSAQTVQATPVDTATLRLHGADRYETAAAVSQTLWEPEYTLVVALVSGEKFPDALSLGPSLSPLGPTLLVGQGTLPAATAAELARLRPCAVVAAGGPSTIADHVLRAANSFTDPASCNRVG